jgi:rubrerythrin
MTMQTDSDPLALAFVHQSVAAAKNRVRAQKAAQEGRPAPLFLALAKAQEVHAKKALMLLRGRIGSVDENLAEAVQEARELAVDSLSWTVLAQAEGESATAALLLQMARAVASHVSPKAQAAPEYWVCGICGHIHADQTPGRCPVCQAVPEKFSLVEA